MKAKTVLNAAVICPKCGSLMYFKRDENSDVKSLSQPSRLVTCTSRECKYFRKTFSVDLPTVEIEEVSDATL